MSRREFLRQASTLGMAAMTGARFAHAEPPPEVTRIRLVKAPGICIAPQFIAEDFLRLEGFQDVQYVEIPNNNSAVLFASDRADFTMDTVSSLLPLMDTSPNFAVLAGIHAGCFSLIGGDGVEHVRDLIGKRVAVSLLGGPDYIFLASVLAYVGMRPDRDVKWIVSGAVPNSLALFQAGEVDAFLAFAPQPQQLHASGLGRVLMDSTTDRPWSQYFCCLAAMTKTFRDRYPAAAKRALRALLRATDLCASDPAGVAATMARKGYERRRKIGLEVISSLPYGRWREANPEDTLRFHALRLHEVGMLRTPPEKLIANGTDWRFLNELKKELKA